jgi:hypothetical protein
LLIPFSPMQFPCTQPPGILQIVLSQTTMIFSGF